MNANAGFVEAIQQPLLKYIELSDNFEKTDHAKMGGAELVHSISLLEEAEHKIMLAWAESTQDINPGLLGDVIRKKARPSRKETEYLMQFLKNN